MADPIISQEVDIEMLEKLSDGTYKKKYPEASRAKGIRVLTQDPSNPKEGEIWINSTEKAMKIFMDGKIQVTNIVKPVYLYDKGVEYVPWVEGYKIKGRLEKEPGDIELRIYGANEECEIAVVTDVPIDLTNVKQIGFLASGSASPDHYLIVSKNKNGNYSDYDARTKFGVGDSEMFLSIGGLEGSYYIRFHTRYNFPSVYREYSLYINSVWLVY